MLQVVHLVDKAWLDRTKVLDIVAFYCFGKLLKFYCYVIASWFTKNLIHCVIWGACAHLHPRMHLCQNEIETLLSVSLVIQNKLARRVVKLEKFNSDLITVSD